MVNYSENEIIDIVNDAILNGYPENNLIKYWLWEGPENELYAEYVSKEKLFTDLTEEFEDDYIESGNIRYIFHDRDVDTYNCTFEDSIVTIWEGEELWNCSYPDLEHDSSDDAVKTYAEKVYIEGCEASYIIDFDSLYDYLIEYRDRLILEQEKTMNR
jgi:hypothetical protein